MKGLMGDVMYDKESKWLKLGRWKGFIEDIFKIQSLHWNSELTIKGH